MIPTDQSFEMRNDQPFCKKCNQPMVAVTMTEVFTVPSQSTGVAFTCEKCGQTVQYPPESRYF